MITKTKPGLKIKFAKLLLKFGKIIAKVIAKVQIIAE